ncbi:MAG: hypothetical protein AB7I42_25965 [Bradyrhizobium sp.]|uniref:hypothetical protein n=1 Tax=Bradyrhizobium sp. TaxID=376 RepID=UPI003D0CE47E
MSQTPCPNSNLRFLTLTGADDTVDPEALANLVDDSGLKGRLEIGLLVSESRRGSHRFPSGMHMDRLIDALLETDANLSLHVCGLWTREIMQGEWDSLKDHVGYRFDAFHRVQLNFHAEPHEISDRFYSQAKKEMVAGGFDIILQYDGTNLSLFHECEKRGLLVEGLYDLSGGRGIAPGYWPNAVRATGGYAGGLGPHNLAEQLPVIARAAGAFPYWIDMETHLYDEAKNFSLERCRAVIDIVHAFEAQREAA